MNVQYRHDQPGYLMIVTAVISLVASSFLYAYGPRPLWMPIVGMGVFILFSGYKLTVEIKDCVLKFWFGPGIFWKNVPLEQIAYCEPFKGVIFGWGIHVGPGGWLYNVSGMKAVTVVLKSGKKMFIGTDEPQRLVDAVNSAIKGLGGDETLPVWIEVKVDYLKRVEQALSAVRHPRSFEILADVSSHLDRRFAELETQNHNWENFQKIATEMGPPSEYAELVGGKKTKWYLSSAVELISICLFLVMVAVSAYFYPRMPEQIATHWDGHGQVNGYMPKLPGMLMMPAILAAFIMVVIIVPRVASVWANIKGFRKLFGNLLILMSVFMSLAQYHIILWNIGIKINPMIVIIPMTVAIIGWIVFWFYRARRQS
jgi:hypothetical protein